MSEESKQRWGLGTWLNMVGAVFSLEFGSFFSTNKRSLAEFSLLFLRNSRSSIRLLLVPLNTEHMPRRPKGGRKEDWEWNCVSNGFGGSFEIIKQQTRFHKLCLAIQIKLFRCLVKILFSETMLTVTVYYCQAKWERQT